MSQVMNDINMLQKKNVFERKSVFFQSISFSIHAEYDLCFIGECDLSCAFIELYLKINDLNKNCLKMILCFGTKPPQFYSNTLGHLRHLVDT